jgi:hypothetical protein
MLPLCADHLTLHDPGAIDMTLPRMQAMKLQQISTPFDDDDWICEVMSLIE